MSNWSTRSDEPAFEPDLDTIERYLAGECTEAEVDVVGKWLQDELPESAGLKALEGYVLNRAGVPSLDLGAVKARLHEEARGGRGGVRNRSYLGTLRYGVRAVRGWAKVAGALTTTLILGYVWISKLEKNTPVQVATRAYITAPGERATVRLSDGTIINLNVATHISVPDGFGKTHRTVELDGEAQFTVAHSAKLPFSVKANGTIVRDLATVFAVRAYKGVTQTRIAVRDGLISVQTPTLTPGNSVRIAKNNVIEVAQDGFFKVTQIARSDDTYFSWTEGKLVLRQQSLGTALTELSRWYGLEFRTGDAKLLSYNVSAQLPQHFDMSDIQDIADIMGAKAVRNGNMIVFYPRSTTN